MKLTLKSDEISPGLLHCSVAQGLFQVRLSSQEIYQELSQPHEYLPWFFLLKYSFQLFTHEAVLVSFEGIGQN